MCTDILYSKLIKKKDGWLVLWCQRHFQQYFSYIAPVSFIGGENRSTQSNHRPAASHWQTLSHNVVHLGSRTDNISGDRHQLHR
jgi:hypothetical protein